MKKQLNVRVPERTEKQLQEIIETQGMTQTQAVVTAIDRFHASIKQEEQTSMVVAYQRDINAGFATETVLVVDSIVVDQFVKTYNQAAQVEGLPDLKGQLFASLRGKGFKRISNQRRVDELYEHYREQEPYE